MSDNFNEYFRSADYVCLRELATELIAECDDDEAVVNILIKTKRDYVLEHKKRNEAEDEMNKLKEEKEKLITIVLGSGLFEDRKAVETFLDPLPKNYYLATSKIKMRT